MRFKILAFFGRYKLCSDFSRNIAMASAGMKSAFDELFGKGSRKSRGTFFDEFSAQTEEETRKHIFGYGDSDCEDVNIPAPLYDMDNQGRAKRYEEMSNDEEIFDESRGNKLTDEEGSARENEDGGEDRACKVAKTTGGSLHGTARAQKAVSAAMEGAGSNSGSEMSCLWSNAVETVWEGKNTDFTGEHPEDGEILLPRECGINPHPRARGGAKQPHCGN